MNNEEIMGCDTLSVLVLERNVGADANTEYTLPEYLPEIRKLLHVEQTVIPPAKYVNSSSAQMNGTVDYRVLYVGADGGLYTAPVSAEYRVNIPIDMQDFIDSSEGLEMMCSVCGESVNPRATGPRRISIRSRLKCTVRVIGKVRLCESMLGEVNLMSIYKRRESCLTAEYCSSCSDIFETEYEISPLSEGMRIADADAKVFVDSVNMGDGRISCRGDVMFRALGIDENSGELMKVSKKLPFESEIELDREMPDSLVRVRGIPSEVRVEIDEDRAICKIGVMIEACCLANREAEYTADIYSSERECKTVEQEYESAQVLLCKNANITLSERLSSEDAGLSADAEIVEVFASAAIDSCKRENDKVIFDGSTKLSVVCVDNGEYSCTDMMLPFRYETDSAFDGEPTSFSGAADIVSIRANNDGGNFSVDAELALGVDCMGKSRISAVDEVEFGETAESEENALIVCYPSQTDTLWSVAKRYKVAPSKISGDPQVDKYIIIE